MICKVGDRVVIRYRFRREFKAEGDVIDIWRADEMPPSNAEEVVGDDGYPAYHRILRIDRIIVRRDDGSVAICPENDNIRGKVIR